MLTRLLGGRFTLVDLAGKGASAEVYRAVDEATGQAVAVKLAFDKPAKLTADATEERFKREQRLLGAISSPHVVRLIGHGASDDGRLFIAVEWLEGADLAHRQKHHPLDGRSIVEVITQVAAGLDAVHRLGCVHRDVKPANIFVADMADGRVRATVIDLGIAWSDGEPALTHAGRIIGTPWYMSPEQILRSEALTPASDQFSLGILAFELITGARPYQGDDAIAIVAKIALTDPPRLREAAPDVPADVEAIVARAMSKEPHDRYPTITEFAEALAAATPFEAAMTEYRADAETRLISSSRVVSSSTIAIGEKRVVTALFARFASAEEAGDARAAFERAVEVRGGVPHALLSLAHVAVFGSARSTGDEPRRATAAALALIREIPHADVVVTTGRTVGGPLGLPLDAVERGARAPQSHGDNRRVRIDEPTARLLGDAYEIRRVGSQLEVFGERRPQGWARTFLGATSVCVGRDRELAQLEALYAQVASESVARVAIVVAPPGAGKSRLRQELLSRLGAREIAPTVFLGHGNAIAEGATFGLVGSALRNAAAVRDEDSTDERRRKIAALVSASCGERVGSALLHIAAPDAEPAEANALTADRLRAAFEEWLRDRTSRQPVAVILDDVHWADAPSINLVDSALRNLSDRPLFVLALARPEVKTRFPRLFEARDPERLSLAKLTRKASEAMVRGVVGETIPAQLIERILTRADGNPFFLEELVRAFGSAGPASVPGPAFELPDTVLGIVQARLDALGPDAKRIIKAASIFGEAATATDVAAVLGSDDVAAVERGLNTLATDEVLEERGGEGEATFVFRHALLRDGAYELLLDEDRKVGHQRAGAWLANRGERDALVIARHFELGGAFDEAMPHYARAAEHALQAGDFVLAVTCADKALHAGAQGHTAGKLLVVTAESKRWIGEYEAAIEAATRAADLLQAGSRQWFAAMREIIDAHGRLGDLAAIGPLAEQVWAAEPAADAAGAKITALTLASTSLLYNGDTTQGAAIVAQVELVAKGRSDLSAPERARVHELRGTLAGLTDQLQRARDEYTRALAWLDPAGEERRALIVRSNLGFIQLQLGEIERAEATLAAALPVAIRLGVETTRALLLQNLGIALRLQWRGAEAVDIQTRALELFLAHKDPRLAGWSRMHLAILALDRADLDGALDRAKEVLAGGVEMQAIGAHAVVSRALLQGGAPVDSLASAKLAVQAIERVGCVEDFDILAYVTLAEAQIANGEALGAKESLRLARERLKGRLDGIQDPALRASFVERIPDHARVYELCRALDNGDARQ